MGSSGAGPLRGPKSPDAKLAFRMTAGFAYFVDTLRKSDFGICGHGVQRCWTPTRTQKPRREVGLQDDSGFCLLRRHPSEKRFWDLRTWGPAVLDPYADPKAQTRSWPSG